MKIDMREGSRLIKVNTGCDVKFSLQNRVDLPGNPLIIFMDLIRIKDGNKRYLSKGKIVEDNFNLLEYLPHLCKTIERWKLLW